MFVLSCKLATLWRAIVIALRARLIVVGRRNLTRRRIVSSHSHWSWWLASSLILATRRERGLSWLIPLMPCDSNALVTFNRDLGMIYLSRVTGHKKLLAWRQCRYCHGWGVSSDGFSLVVCAVSAEEHGSVGMVGLARGAVMKRQNNYLNT